MQQPARIITDTEAATVRTAVTFSSGGSQTDLLGGELVYEASDPFAISMHIDVPTGVVVWTFARELLAEGLYEPTGAGDVQTWPCLSSSGEAVIIIELTSPDGTAMLQTLSRDVQAFVAETFELVADGQEARHLCLDDLVSHLLAG